MPLRGPAIGDRLINCQRFHKSGILDMIMPYLLHGGMKGLIICLCLAPLFQASAKPLSGGALLDQVISKPGSYSQVCDVMVMPSDIPYRAYQISDFNGTSFSQANKALIQENREPLIAAIKARLTAVDFSKSAVDTEKDEHPEKSFDGDGYGCDPATLNPLILNLIVDMNAVEALPELLTLEARLVKEIAKAKDSATAPVPIVSGWGIGEKRDSSNDGEARDRRINLFQARVAQRDLVMVMQVLMRNKKYSPALKTSLEVAYVKGLKADAAAHGWDKFKPGDELPKEINYRSVERDPVTGIVRDAYRPIEIPYTRESRDEVRAAAEQWVKEHS